MGNIMLHMDQDYMWRWYVIRNGIIIQSSKIWFVERSDALRHAKLIYSLSDELLLA